MEIRSKIPKRTTTVLGIGLKLDAEIFTLQNPKQLSRT
jgi:hypothetical protein